MHDYDGCPLRLKVSACCCSKWWKITDVWFGFTPTTWAAGLRANFSHEKDPKWGEIVIFNDFLKLRTRPKHWHLVKQNCNFPPDYDSKEEMPDARKPQLAQRYCNSGHLTKKDFFLDPTDQTFTACLPYFPRILVEKNHHHSSTS